MINQIKTVVLLGALSGLVLWIGNFFGGSSGLSFALAFAVLMNLGAYLFSHKIVLALYRARPLDEKSYPWLHKMVGEVAKKAGLPKPKLYIVPTSVPNAFATGPSRKKAVVAFTEGILELLEKEELRGVVAHELSHIKNKDMLVSTIAAALAATISYIASVARWAAVFGTRDQERGENLIGLLALTIITPIVAVLIQLAISRSREYLADQTGAKTIMDSESLARALEKLELSVKKANLKPSSLAHLSASSLFVVNPFKSDFFVNLLSTHPPVSKRVELLRKMQF